MSGGVSFRMSYLLIPSPTSALTKEIHKLNFQDMEDKLIMALQLYPGSQYWDQLFSDSQYQNLSFAQVSLFLGYDRLVELLIKFGKIDINHETDCGLKAVDIVNHLSQSDESKYGRLKKKLEIV